jgi:flagellar biosynthesis protein FlhF
MTPKVFIGCSTTDALLQVRTDIGPDAVVLSTRQVENGIEIVAISPKGLSAETKRPVEQQPQAPAAKKPAIDPPPAAQVNPDQAEMMQFLREVRGLVKDKLSRNAWDALEEESASVSEALRLLLHSGFSAALCGELVDQLRTRHLNSPVPIAEQVRPLLEERMSIVDPFAEFDGGGVYAFLGPTGVGKTTVTAKIVARCVLRYGRDQVAILSTDNYRIGAQEQIKTYAKIIGIPVYSIKDKEDLQVHLKEIGKKKLIFIDTAGVSQRDIQMLEQLQLLTDGITPIKMIAVVSATTNLMTLEEVFRLHGLTVKQKTGAPLFSVIITKTDEAAQIGSVVDAVIRHKLPVMFIANGQHVPEDLTLADIPYLAFRALSPQPSSLMNEVPSDNVPTLLRDQLSAWAIAR